MPRPLTAALVASLLAMTGCVTVPPATNGPVALQQTQRVGPLRVTPIELVEDNRCPENARCIWAGRVVVRVAIHDGRERLERNVTLGEAADLGSRKLMLDSVTPGRIAGAEPDPDPAAYRFHFALAE